MQCDPLPICVSCPCYLLGGGGVTADEFDFHVSNLAVDFRDGVRLTRLVEVVTSEWGLAAVLRVPAVSRLQARVVFA